LLDWSDSLSVGVPEIDAQHRTLLERAAALQAAVAAREPAVRVEELFTYLQDYASAHFDSEERVMREAGYPGLQEHVMEHAEFRRRLASLVPHWESEGASTALTVALLGFLEHWLEVHVTTTDQRMGACLRRHRAPARREASRRAG
jgi:hemerythrin